MSDTRHLNRRDFLKVAGAALAAGLAGVYAPAVLAADDDHPPEFWHGRRDVPAIALTYDDCYLVKKLQSLERTLANYPEAKITFFPVGEALLSTDAKDPGIWRRFHQKGYEIGCHSFDHTNPGVRSVRGMIEDYDKWLAAYTQVVGETPTVRFARPPFGSLSASFRQMCAARNLVVAMWSASWGGPLDQAQKHMNDVRNGDIVLMHISTQDVEENTDAALPFLAARGLRAVTMSDLYFGTLKEELGAGNCTAPAYPYRTRACPE
ncbi:MAG: polysaccharide deacetylase family protein [Chloroflexi bacterium]|nr:polysaccharide deacetylase family protein [Chloroflexota bacterium]